jgi:tRNA (guanine37-N1)-methyltransferase
VKFDVVTIFPQMFSAPLAEGVVARGVAAGVVDLKVHDLREFTTDRHRVVDDVPYGGGPGMVLKPEPLTRAVEHLKATRGTPGAIVLTSPQGRVLGAEAELARGLGHVAILCGRYEGVDERIREHVATEISIGDYVLSGGELAAMVIIDAVSRFVPAWWATSDRSARIRSREACSTTHYEAGGVRRLEGADVLLSGHHARSTGGGGGKRFGARWNGVRICWMARRSDQSKSRCAGTVERRGVRHERD